MSTVTNIRTTLIDSWWVFYLKGPPGTLGVQGPVGPRGQRGRPVSTFKLCSLKN